MIDVNIEIEEMTVNKMLSFEEELIAKECTEQELSIDSFNVLLGLPTDENTSRQVHYEFIRKQALKILIDYSRLDLVDKLDLSNVVMDHFGLPTVDMLEDFHTDFLNSSFSMDSSGVLKRKKSKTIAKENGAVYTSLNTVSEIVEKSLVSIEYYENFRALDFGCATGRFYFVLAESLKSKFNIKYHKIFENNVFAVDIDRSALLILKLKVIELLRNDPEVDFSKIFKNIILENALTSHHEFGDLFSENAPTELKNESFDLITSNPPYANLKVNIKDKSSGSAHYLNSFKSKVKDEVNYFRNSGMYHYSNQGMLNYYKLSIEKMMKLLKPNGVLGVICPSSLFGDLSSSKLRSYLLSNNQVKSIRYFPEKAGLFENVTQSTVIFTVVKGGRTKDIEIEYSDKTFKVKYSDILESFPQSLEVPLIPEVGWRILRKLKAITKLKDRDYIRNKRGELDLTLHKSFVTDTKTGYRLVRGNMIKQDHIADKNGEYVKVKEFVAIKSKVYSELDFEKPRIIGQQISNVDSLKRLIFVQSEPTDIMGNSCNYITITDDNVSPRDLMVLLNSYLLNWRFKITSTNNHVNNYELDELPILDVSGLGESIGKLEGEVREREICSIYGLDDEEIEYIIDFHKK